MGKEFMTFENWFVDWLSNMIKEFSGNFNEACQKIFYDNDLPFNSFDRIFALYLIDQHFDIVEKFDVEKAKVSKEYCEKYFKENIEQNDCLSKEWENNNNRAYYNYEREGISDIVAFVNMLYIAKKGQDAVLENNYYNCEWFGSS